MSIYICLYIYVYIYIYIYIYIYTFRDARDWRLLGLSELECDFGQRLIISVILGAVIGYVNNSQETRPYFIPFTSLSSPPPPPLPLLLPSPAFLPS
jgi:hypothetical protein